MMGERRQGDSLWKSRCRCSDGVGRKLRQWRKKGRGLESAGDAGLLESRSETHRSAGIRHSHLEEALTSSHLSSSRSTLKDHKSVRRASFRRARRLLPPPLASRSPLSQRFGTLELVMSVISRQWLLTSPCFVGAASQIRKGEPRRSWRRDSRGESRPCPSELGRRCRDCEIRREINIRRTREEANGTSETISKGKRGTFSTGFSTPSTNFRQRWGIRRATQ